MYLSGNGAVGSFNHGKKQAGSGHITIFLGTLAVTTAALIVMPPSPQGDYGKAG